LWIERRDAAFARAGDFCEVSGQKLVGRCYLSYVSGGVEHQKKFEAWERACHHIIAERFARKWLPGCDVHILENLLVVSRQLHARLTAAENRLFNVDIIGYKSELNRLGIGPDIFDRAWTALCESRPQRLLLKHSNRIGMPE
jgi:hypothetical protein